MTPLGWILSVPLAFGFLCMLGGLAKAIFGIDHWSEFRNHKKQEPKTGQWTFVNFDSDGSDCADGRHEFKSGQWTVNINGTVFTSDGKKS